jgi:hypothetical protein
MNVRARSLVMGAVCLLTACGGGDDDGVGGGADGGTVSDTIGPAGGTVTIAGAELSIPAGALAEDVSITITETAEEAPAGFLGSSAIYQFEPDGLVFAQPAAARIDFTGDGSELDLIWSTADGGGYQAMGGAVDGTTVSADITHFSRGFAGRIDPGGDCGGGCPAGEECLAGVCVDPGSGVACNDGEDNDGDQLIDGDDGGCFIPTDESEKIDCQDGIDNDGDSTIDFGAYTVLPAPIDTGCTSASDGSEKPECSDGYDNDMDGHIDLDDPNCSGNPDFGAEAAFG